MDGVEPERDEMDWGERKIYEINTSFSYSKSHIAIMLERYDTITLAVTYEAYNITSKLRSHMIRGGWTIRMPGLICN